MQALLDYNHPAFGRLVNAGHQRPLEPVMDGVAHRLGAGFGRFKRVIDDNETSALVGRRPLNRGRHAALGRGAHIR